MKRCSRCHETKELSKFGKDRTKSSGIRGYCKGCSNNYNREYKLKNKERTLNYHRAYRQTIEGRYRLTISSVKSRGFTFDIPLLTYSMLILNPCVYCEGPLPKTQGGLDRIDNTLGYEVSNVVPCCSPCNMLKSDRINHDEMLDIVEHLSKKRGVPKHEIWSQYEIPQAKQRRNNRS